MWKQNNLNNNFKKIIFFKTIIFLIHFIIFTVYEVDNFEKIENVENT